MSVEHVGRGIGRWLTITHLRPPATCRGTSSSPETKLYCIVLFIKRGGYHVAVNAVPIRGIVRVDRAVPTRNKHRHESS